MSLNPKLNQYKKLIATFAPKSLSDKEELIPAMEDEQEKIDSNLGAISPSMDKLQTQQEATTPVPDDIPGMDKRTEEEMSAADEIAQEAVDLENKVKPEIQQAEEPPVPRDAFGGTTQMSQDYMNMPETDKAGGRTPLSQAYLDMPENYRSNIQDQELSLDNEIQPPQMSRLDMYRNLLSQAQKDRRAGLLTSNMLLAGNQIAQGFARSRGGQIGAGEEAVRTLREQAQLPVSELGEEMKTSKDALELSLRESKRDPNSPISKYSALLAATTLKRLNPQIDDKQLEEIKKMSADEIDQLNIGGVGSFRTPQQSDYETISGDPLSFDPITNSFINIRTGLPYSGKTRRKVIQEFVDPKTGQKSLRAGDQFINISDSPKLDKKEIEKPKTAFEIRDLVDPNTFKELQNIKQEFIKETDQVRQVIAGLEGTKELVKLAEKNPAGKPIAAAAVTRLFEKGVLTDQDVVRYVVRGGLFNSAEDYLSALSTGTFSKEQVVQLAQALDAYKTQQMQQVQNIAKEKAENASGYVDPKTGVSVADLYNLFYTPNKTAFSENKGASGLTPEQRRKRIQELKAKQGK